MAPYNYAGSFNWCVPSALFPTTENAYGLPGFTVVQIFADDSKYLNFISMGLVGAVLLVFAAWTAKPGAFAPLFGGRVPNTRSSLSPVRKAIFLYQVITGVFFWALVTQLNKVVVVMAALHNWCEWLILAHVYMTTMSGKQEFGRIASAWVWFVMFMILFIPDVIHAFAFEQVVGLWPDFQLLIASWLLAAKFKEPPHREAFQYFKYAATFHIMQIITLLVQGLGFLTPWPTAQFLIMGTALFNYYYYTRFAVELDAINFGEETSDEESDKSTGKRAAYQSMELYHTKGSKLKFAALCLVLSTVSVVGPVVVLDNCVQVRPDPNNSSHEVNVRLTLYKIGNEMSVDVKTRRKLLNSVRAKRDKPNNLIARLYTNEKEFVVYEIWNGTFSDSKPSSDNDLPVTKILTGYSLSDGTQYKPPSLEYELLSGGASPICQSKAPSGFTIINAKDAFKDAVTIKMVAEAGFSRKATSNDFYLPAVDNMDDRKIFVFETWKSGFDLNVHLITPSVIRLGIFSWFMAHHPVEYGTGFHELDMFRHC